MKHITSRQIALNGLIAGLYAVVTILTASFAYGNIQFRLAEALCLLVALEPTRDLEINRQAGYPVSLAKMVSEDGVKSIGFENRVMIYSDAVELQKELPPVTWLPPG